MDRAGSELDGARESLVKACPDAQVGHRGFPRSCLHQGLYWGGRCEGTRRLGEELGPVQPTPRSGGRCQPHAGARWISSSTLLGSRGSRIGKQSTMSTW